MQLFPFWLTNRTTHVKTADSLMFLTTRPAKTISSLNFVEHSESPPIVSHLRACMCWAVKSQRVMWVRPPFLRVPSLLVDLKRSQKEKLEIEDSSLTEGIHQENHRSGIAIPVPLSQV